MQTTNDEEFHLELLFFHGSQNQNCFESIVLNVKKQGTFQHFFQSYAWWNPEEKANVLHTDSFLVRS